jgi:hypothetical protein
LNRQVRQSRQGKITAIFVAPISATNIKKFLLYFQPWRTWRPWRFNVFFVRTTGKFVFPANLPCLTFRAFPVKFPNPLLSRDVLQKRTGINV